MIIFVKKMSDLQVVSKVLPDPTDKRQRVTPHIISSEHDCPQINICTIEGPLFFGSAQMFEKTVRRVVHPEAKILILRLGKVPYIDTTGESNLSNIVKAFKANGGTILVSGLQAQPLSILKKTITYLTMKV